MHLCYLKKMFLPTLLWLILSSLHQTGGSEDVPAPIADRPTDQHEWELKLSPEEALRELQDNLYDIVTASYDANNPAADKESTGDHESHRSQYSSGNPLISLMNIKPHSMKIQIKPRIFNPTTMVRLLYERVPRNKPPQMHHLDDPVIEFIPLYRELQDYDIENLPMGKYIVCGEAQINGTVTQANCFETLVDRLDNNMLQSGVIGIIAVAILIVVSVILYAVYHRVNSIRLKRKARLESGENKTDMNSNVEKRRPVEDF